MKNDSGCSLAEGFSVWEKAWAQVSFWVMGIAGTVGILLANWIWVFPYLVVYWYGIPGVIMRHTNCPRCPHLHEFGDCLQAPVALTSIFTLIPAYPVFWLLPRPALLITFLIGAGMWYGGQFFHFCRRCRVSACPFNRAPTAWPA
jgi:hypothetical protein